MSDKSSAVRREAPAAWLVSALCAAGALTATGVATGISWQHMADRRPLDLFVRAAGWLAIALGTVAWARGVRVRLACLLVVLGVALFMRDLRESPRPLVHAIGLSTAYVWTAVTAQLALAWPEGSLRGRATHALVATCYLFALGTQLMRVIDTPSGEFWPRTGSAAAGVLALTVVTVVGYRWWNEREQERPAELVVVSMIIVGLIGSWVAFLEFDDSASARLDAMPVLVGLSVIPVAILAYLRLRAQLLDVQASRRLAEQALLEARQSRRRIVETTTLERSRMQHDLHEGAQQGLVSVQLLLWEAERAVQPTPDADLDAARAKLAAARSQLADAVDELHALVQGLYPAVLQDHGLSRALEEVARLSPVPVVIDVTDRRWAPELEITAYFCTKEAIANALKYAHASRIDVTAHDDDSALLVRIQDDGLGEALPPWDGGLRMLQDRVEAFGGRITDFRSARKCGTSITLRLPHPAATPDTPREES